jgi:hypothetical protein
VLNYSDHLPVCITCCSLFDGHVSTSAGTSNANQQPNCNSSCNYAWRWDTANKDLYRRLTEQYLNEIVCNVIDDTPPTRESIIQKIEELYGDIVQALDRSAWISVPKKKTDFFKQWWDSELDESKNKSI